jgi:signal transduction histidine kinase
MKVYRQLVLILLNNAVKYTPAGGHIIVAIDESDPRVYSVVVRDTGPGIPPEVREKIFERFYRVDKARSRSSVAGGVAALGLAIGKWIAGMHGGSLSLVDTDRKGSTFRATILRRSLPVD